MRIRNLFFGKKSLIPINCFDVKKTRPSWPCIALIKTAVSQLDRVFLPYMDFNKEIFEIDQKVKKLQPYKTHLSATPCINLDGDHNVFVVFHNLSKAFDCVDRDALSNDLIYYGILMEHFFKSDVKIKTQFVC